MATTVIRGMAVIGGMAVTTDNSASRPSHAVTVAIASLAIFLIVMALLLIRLESGRDPAIAAGEHATTNTQKRTLVLERRLVETDRANGRSSGVSSTARQTPDSSATQTPDSAPAAVTRQS